MNTKLVTARHLQCRPIERQRLPITLVIVFENGIAYEGRGSDPLDIERIDRVTWLRALTGLDVDTGRRIIGPDRRVGKCRRWLGIDALGFCPCNALRYDALAAKVCQRQTDPVGIANAVGHAGIIYRRKGPDQHDRSPAQGFTGKWPHDEAGIGFGYEVLEPLLHRTGCR